jgi:hypothetical protein
MSAAKQASANAIKATRQSEILLVELAWVT